MAHILALYTFIFLFADMSNTDDDEIDVSQTFVEATEWSQDDHGPMPDEDPVTVHLCGRMQCGWFIPADPRYGYMRRGVRTVRAQPQTTSVQTAASVPGQHPVPGTLGNVIEDNESHGAAR